MDHILGRWRLFFVVILCSLVWSVWGHSDEILPLSQVRPGMIGYGLSVFRGDHIERFHVQVIDILPGVLPEEDVILVRCSPAHAGFDITRSGLVAGMSGSPIYLEGKLAGALSRGWAFAKEPLAGVTPIENMLTIPKRPLEKKMAAIQKQAHSAASGSLVPLQMPLLVSGLTPDTFAHMQKEFEPYGWLLVQGGSGAGRVQGKGDTKLVPGAALAVQLITGDIELAGIGTVTWVNNDEVLAFGHPFLESGELNVPISTAHIAGVMESQWLSFKLGYPLTPVGTLLQDRPSGIYGKLGKTCDMLPMSVEIRNKITGLRKNFAVRMVRHPFLTPRLCALAIVNFLNIQEAVLGDSTVWIQSLITLKDSKQPLLWKNVYTGPQVTPGNLVAPFLYLYDNPFQKVEMEQIQVALEVTPKMQLAAIASIQTTTSEVKAGETLLLKVALTAYQDESSILSLPFPVPANTPPGEYVIAAMGGATAAKGGTTFATLPAPIYENSAQYLASVHNADKYRNNQLVVAMSLPQLKVLCEGKELDELPGSIIGNFLPPNASKSIQLIPQSAVVVTETPYLVVGEANLVIQIKDK